MSSRSEHGFSLIELLIVVAIILIIAAIAIPNMMRSKLAANEASAISSIRAVNTAQVAYAASYPNVGYANDMARLGSPPPGTPVSESAAGLLDWVLGCATQPCPKSGYLFNIDRTAGNPVVVFRVTGVPALPGQSGIRGFCSNDLGPVEADPAGGTNCTIQVQ